MIYGVSYQGSKNVIAEDIIRILPTGKRLIDLFGGGAAISHCAVLSGKWKNVIYNEYNPLLVNLIKNAIAGNYKDDKRWISREDFFKLKEQDGYVKYCWSFGSAGNNYLYSKEIEPWKKALHYAIVLGDTSLFAEFGIKTDGSRSDVKKNKAEYKRKYTEWYLKNILKTQDDFEKLRNNLQEKIKNQKEQLRLYMCDALEKSGLKQSDINKRLNAQMSGHWFGRSQWLFPTREFYNQMREFMPLKDYDEVYGYAELLESLQSLQRLQSLQSLERLQSLQSLESLESLQSLQRLERLQSLERLQRLEVKQGSYLDYVYKDGDVVYCDPPYENTFNYDKTDFNHTEFYDWVASRPFKVYFSSYEISDKRFYKIWSTSKRKLMCGASSDTVTEFVYCNQPDKVTLFDFID